MLGILRKAGQKIRAFDDAYASALAKYIAGFKPEKASVGQGVQVAASMAAGAPALRKFVVEDDSPILRELMGYGVPTLNAGVRYGVPLAGAAVLSDLLGRSYDALSTVPVIGGNANGQHKAALDEMLKNGQISQEHYERML